MPAEITFHKNILNNNPSDAATVIDHKDEENNAHGKEGIGFYGLSHGLSVPVGSVQNTTWVTNEAGTYSGPQLNNTARVSDGTSSVAGTVSVNAASAINLDQLPNYLCPLNIRFSNDDAVRVQECKLMIFDKNQTSNPASGVTTYVYEARHPADGQGSTIPQLNHRGRTENSWVEFSESIGAIEMTMTPSPGASGLNGDSNDVNSAAGYTSNDGILHSSTRHDWYVALSAKPESIGSKSDYALFFTLEYLS